MEGGVKTMAEKIGGITFYTLKELAEKMNTTPVTLQRYLRQGKIKGNKIGVKWHVTEDSVREFLEGRG